MGEIGVHRRRLKGNDLRLYNAWHGMRLRCRPTYNHPSDHLYYRARGICVDPQWDDFWTFAEDMGPHPGRGWSLDRWPDPEGNYTPDNCRWATAAMQVRNSRCAKLSAEQVAIIRRTHRKRGDGIKLAVRFNVSRSLISLIVNRKVWA